MLANKRQERILELLHQSGQVLVSTLARNWAFQTKPFAAIL